MKVYNYLGRKMHSVKQNINFQSMCKHMLYLHRYNRQNSYVPKHA